MIDPFPEAIHLALHDGDDFPDPATAFGQKFYYIFRLYSDPATTLGFTHIPALLEQYDTFTKCATITRPLPGSKLVDLIDLGIEILWEILCRMRLQYNTVLGLKPENRVEKERKGRILSPIANVLKSSLKAANESIRELKMAASDTGSSILTRKRAAYLGERFRKRLELCYKDQVIIFEDKRKKLKWHG